MIGNPIDNWLPSGTALGTPDQIHAYGVVALAYNKLEDAMVELLAAYLPVSEEASFRFASKLTNNERIGLLLDLVGEIENNLDVRDAVEHAIKIFNLCSENRNILAHGIRDNHVYHDKLFVLRKMSADGRKINHYDISIDDLRKTSLDLLSCLEFVVALILFMIIYRGIAVEDMTAEQWQNHFATLPRKPPQPSKLSPRQPGLDHEDALRLFQPSDPSLRSDDQA